MGTGQMMLTIGAMILLATIMLRINTGNLTVGSSVIEDKIHFIALSFAEGKINEALSKQFDNTPQSPSLVLGPENTDTGKNDIDDYIKTISQESFKIDNKANSTISFLTRVDVTYTFPIRIASTLNWKDTNVVTAFKKITVTVTDVNPIPLEGQMDLRLLRDTVQISAIKSIIN